MAVVVERETINQLARLDVIQTVLAVSDTRSLLTLSQY